MVDGIVDMVFVGLAVPELDGAKVVAIVMKDGSYEETKKLYSFSVQAITTRILNRKRQKLATSEEERALAEFLRADDQDTSRER